jgi:hypothetical protein
MKNELLNIVNKKIGSYYRDFALEIHKEIGSREAGTPIILMNRFEKLRVSNLLLFFFLIYKNLNIYCILTILNLFCSRDITAQKD